MLALIFQSKNPIKTFETIREKILHIPFENNSIKRILEEFAKFSDQNKEFDSKLFESHLPSELVDIYNKSFILPLPSFAEDDEFIKDAKTTSLKLEKSEIKKRIKIISELLQEAEEKNDESRLEKLTQEFTSLASRLKE